MGLERNVESIRSLEGADIVWIEEARTINAKSMEVLLPTIRKAGSRADLDLESGAAGRSGRRLFPRSQGPPPRTIATFVDMTDNPFFYGTELVNEMETLKAGNFARFKHVWLGDYDTKHDSKVFPAARIGRIGDPGGLPAALRDGFRVRQ